MLCAESGGKRLPHPTTALKGAREMKFSAALDVDLVACEGDDEVTVLLELQAPDAATTDRPASALQIVLDRSGSMGGAPSKGPSERWPAPSRAWLRRMYSAW